MTGRERRDSKEAVKGIFKRRKQKRRRMTGRREGHTDRHRDSE